MRMLPLVTVLAVLLIAGCKSPKGLGEDPSTRAATCKPQDSTGDCSIVVDAWLNADGSCDVAVVRSQLTVGFKNGAKDKWIHWTLTGSAADSGFEFARNGIAPKAMPDGNVARWNANFKNDGVSHGGRQFNWKNGNDPAQAGTDYAYMVTVELPRPGTTPLRCTQDPVIRNQR
jgi:hypothetical protein